MDQVQKCCEIRHNWVLADESKLAYSKHIERDEHIYILFEAQEHNGQEVLPDVMDSSKDCGSVDTYLLLSYLGKHSKPGFGRGIIGLFPKDMFAAMLDVLCNG